MSWRVVFYEDKHGHSPVREFIFSLPEKHQAKIVCAFDLLEEFDVALGMPHVRNVEGHRNLWELRVQVAKSAYRVFYFTHTGQHFVMLHAFLKKTPKTPRQEIAIAERRMEELLEWEAGK
jgi:phage-related protein